MIGLVKMFIEKHQLVLDWNPAPRRKVETSSRDRWRYSREWYRLIDSSPLRRSFPTAAEPYEPPAGMCPSPINGKTTVEECRAAGQCGCSAKPQSAVHNDKS